MPKMFRPNLIFTLALLSQILGPIYAAFDCASDEDCPGIGEKCVHPGTHSANCQLVSYHGQCQDEAGSSSLLNRRDEYDWPDCKEKCLTNPRCVAFSYESHNDFRYNCHLFSGGPYVSGIGSDKRCYILRPTCKDKIEACQTAQLDCEQDFVKTNCQKHCNLCQCKNIGAWCDKGKPDCTTTFAKENCAKYCGIC